MLSEADPVSGVPFTDLDCIHWLESSEPELLAPVSDDAEADPAVEAMTTEEV